MLANGPLFGIALILYNRMMAPMSRERKRDRERGKDVGRVREGKGEYTDMRTEQYTLQRKQIMNRLTSFRSSDAESTAVLERKISAKQLAIVRVAVE